MIIRVALAALLAVPGTLAAQIRASEIGTMSQIIDGTKISMEYSRPRSRGRDTLFGTKAVPWNRMWTPGANWATTLEVNKSIKLNGTPVAKGKYSVWMIPRAKARWTVVLDTDDHRYHEEPPDSNAAQIRLLASVDTVPFTDVLTWSMPALRINGGTLAMQWERARVSMNVEVEPSLVSTLPAADAAPYIGEYTYTERDTAGKPAKTMRFIVTHENGALKGQWQPDDPYFKKFALIRIAPDWFAPGLYDGAGEIYEVLKPDMVFEFTRQRGTAASIVVRLDNDLIFATATRRP